MAELVQCGKYEGPVNAGEDRLLKFLEVNLPEGYYLLPGIEIPYLNPRNKQVQYLEYDCLVLTPHAIYNVENKDYSGRLEGDDDYWYLNDREKRNPHKTLRFKTGVLASKLKETNPEWGRVWIQSIVTLSHPRQSRAGLWGKHLHATFELNELLVGQITDAENVNKSPNSISDIYKAVRDNICGVAKSQPTHERKEVMEFEILEILDQDKNTIEFLAKPKNVTSANRKRIREYTLDLPSLPADQRERREKQIKNQYNAINRIRKNPFILNVEFRMDDENHLFYEITDHLEENSLRYEMKRKTFTLEEKTEFVFNLITALKAAHEVNVYHRDINPENVFITGGYACLANFGKSYFQDHYKDGYTVMPTITESNATAYHPLELLAGDASRGSDIYSLGVLVYELFVGKLPFNHPFDLNKIGGQITQEQLPSSINNALPSWLDEFCLNTLRIPPEDRWDNLLEMEEFLREAVRKPDAGLINDPKPSSNEIEYSFEVGERVGDYTIYKTLGEGGYSRVFMVKHNFQSPTEYAMKVFNESVSAKSVMDEYNALLSLDHPNIVKFTWNGTLNNGLFYTLMEYLEGENLKSYAKGEKRLPIHRVYQVAEQILKALVSMQTAENPILHRDIKPQNIVWDKKNERFVLIDFNVASISEADISHAGTYSYLAPDLIEDGNHVNWDNSADTFALGLTLYELACKNYPWSGKMPLIQPPSNPQEYNPKLADSFATFLLKAVEPKKKDRFSDAEEMLEALQAIDTNNLLQPEESPDSEVIVIDQTGDDSDFVHYLNTLYSQSKHGNKGTRASNELNTFDKITYTNTKLDRKLIPDVLDGKYKLVIITGNAGDGKTAFIRKIEEKAQNRESIEHGNGAHFDIKDIPFESNYDGSQDEEGRANNDVLSAFFKPFEGSDDFNGVDEGRIIAINEGRLVEFLRSAGEFDGLAEIIENYFYQDGRTELPEGLLIVNLNLRSMVATTDGGESLFKQQIKKLTAKSLWKKCESCPLASQCFIRYNVATLNDTAGSDEVISRLEWLVRTVSLKQELHITIRDLRSFLSFLITRDYHCSDISGLWEAHQAIPDKWWQYFYFNISDPQLKDSGWNDRLIKLIRETDLAERPQPAMDRDLFYGQHLSTDFIEFSERSVDLHSDFNEQKLFEPIYEQPEERQNQIKRLHKVWARHQYFEGKISFGDRLPYHSIFHFHELLVGENNEKAHEDLLKTRKSIAKAIALNEGCANPAIYNKHLVLSSAHTHDPFSQSFRLFDLTDFEIIVSKSDHLVNYLEYEPDHLLFRKKNDHKVTLVLSLDLFEMLDFISQGYSPSLNDIRGRFIELQIFKNVLENEIYHKVVVSKDQQKFFNIGLNSEQGLEISPLTIDA